MQRYQGNRFPFTPKHHPTINPYPPPEIRTQYSDPHSPIPIPLPSSISQPQKDSQSSTRCRTLVIVDTGTLQGNRSHAICHILQRSILSFREVEIKSVGFLKRGMCERSRQQNRNCSVDALVLVYGFRSRIFRTMIAGKTQDAVTER